MLHLTRTQTKWRVDLKARAEFEAFDRQVNRAIRFDALKAFLWRLVGRLGFNVERKIEALREHSRGWLDAWDDERAELDRIECGTGMLTVMSTPVEADGYDGWLEPDEQFPGAGQ